MDEVNPDDLKTASLCYYCVRQPASEKRAVVAVLIEGGWKSKEQTKVPVPRCEACAALHRTALSSASTVGGFAALLMMPLAVGGCIAWAPMFSPRRQPLIACFEFFAVLFIVMTVAGIAFLIGIWLFRPKGIPRVGDVGSYQPIKDLTAKGWLLSTTNENDLIDQ